MTPNTLSALAAMLLSLALAYVPGLAPRWRALPGDHKRLLLAGALALVAGGSYALACVPQFVVFRPAAFGLACTQPDLNSLLSAFVLALVANQGTYVLAVRERTTDGSSEN
jgi:hypothetical protein